MNRFFSRYALFRNLILASVIFFQFFGCSSSDNSPQTLVVAAKKFMSEGKSRHALIKLKQSLQKDPNQSEARYLLSTIYLGQNSPSSAETEIRKAIKLGLKREKWIEILGRSLLLQSSNQKMLDEIRQAETDSQAVKSLIALLRGNAYLGLGKYSKAGELYLKSKAYSPENVSPLFGLARIAIIGKQYAKGMDLLDKVLARQPTHAQALIQKGDIYLNAGNKEEALRVYSMAAGKNLNPYAALKKVYVLISMGKVDEAASDLAVVLKKYPTSLLAGFLNARIHFLNGDIDGASDLLQEVFRVDSNYLPAQLLNGIIMLAKGSDRQAEQSLLKYLSVNPRNLLVSKLLAIAQLRAGSYDSVIKRLSDKNKTPRPDQEALTLLGLAFLHSDQIDKARVILSVSASIKSSLSSNKRTDAGNVKIKANESAHTVVQDLNVYEQAYKGLLEKEMSELVNKNVSAVPDYFLAALLAVSSGDQGQASGFFEQAIEQKDNSLDVQLSYAAWLLKNRQWQKAEGYLKNVLTRDKANEKALVMRVQLYELQGKKVAALKWLKKAWKRNRKSRVLGLSVFKYYLREKNLKQSGKVQEKLIALHGDDVRMMRTMALLYRKNNDLKNAINVLKKTWAKHPDNDSIQFLLANAEADSGDLASAAQRYKRILGNKEKNIQVMVALARLYVKQKAVEAAVNLAREIIKRYPDNATGYRLLGKITLLQKQPKKALAYFEKALSLRIDPGLFLDYSKLLVRDGRLEKAVFQLRDWLFRYPKHYQSRLLLASIYQMKKDNEKALKEYMYLENNNAYNVIVLNNIVWLLLDAGDDRLSGYIEKLARLNNKAAEIQDTLGWAYLSTGKIKKAGEYLIAADRKLGNNPGVQYRLAVYYQKTGAVDKSRRLLKKALARGNRFDEYKVAKELLERL